MNYCPRCGNQMDDYGRCTYCGYVENDTIIDGDAVETESVDADTRFDDFKEKVTETITNTNDDYSMFVPGWLKAVLILLTIFVSPFIGFICGIVLITRPYPSYKSFGIMLLVISIIFMILSLIFGFFAGLFALLLGGARSLMM